MNKSCLLGSVCTLSLLSYQTVYANSAPIANAGPDIYTLVDSVGLLGGATDPDGDPIVAYEWTLDASPAGSTGVIQWPDEPDPLFFFDTLGQYDLSLRASDGMDWSNPDSMSVFAAELIGPKAVATASPLSGTAPLTVQFDGSDTFTQLFDGTSIINGTGSLWDDGTLSSFLYRWNFGDGSDFSSEVAPSHTYAAPGTYTVTFAVLQLGKGDELFFDVTVVPIPAAVWLFGSGLLGLIGIARRKKS